MKKFFIEKKSIIKTLLLILVISNFSLTYAYWAGSIHGNQTGSSSFVQIGDWDFVDEELELEIITFRNDHAVALSLTLTTVETNDKSLVESALAQYGSLSDPAKEALSLEEDLLLSLLTQIIALENSVFLDFEGYVYDSLYTGSIDMDGRTWYANNLAISNSPSYDVWRDTRSLGMKSGSYFESQDLFMNGIDKISLYHGALNYNNGTSFAFKIEYELATNPGVWLTVQEGGSDLIIDVISGDPMTFSLINVSITEALHIRFTPVISNTTDYINLDDILIYEHIVSSQLEATTFRTLYALTLALTVENVDLMDKANVLTALDAYLLLSGDAQSELSIEKAHLDELIADITEQENVIFATASVSFAEGSYLQTDLDAAQLLVTDLLDSVAKTELQNRINNLQITIDTITSFRFDYADSLALTVANVTPSDKADVDAALLAYSLLNDEAKNALMLEKAHLDSLLAEINLSIPTETQVNEFRTTHAAALALTTETVEIIHKAAVQLALDAYALLSAAAQTELTTEKMLLDNLFTEIEEQEAIVEATEAVIFAENSLVLSDVEEAQILIDLLSPSLEKTELQNRLNNVLFIVNEIMTFKTDYVAELLLTEETVTVFDKPAIETALAAFGLLSDAAQAELVDEETLLLNMLTEILLYENSVLLDFEGYVYDSLYTGSIDMDGRTWYANNLAISNSPSYDVWRDTRSLGMKSGSYFESQDLFMNGIDKISLYHGALNYNNGTSFAFKIEYELASNPGVWLTVQEGGSDLIIDVISGDPMTFSLINVSITEALHIRFTPVISNTTDYINLDDIRIYEYMVSSELEIATFKTVYDAVLNLSEITVDLSHKDAVIRAISAYDLLSLTAQAELLAEKALLDGLLIEILEQEAILEATEAVILAENSELQSDLDAAQLLVNILEEGIVKTDLQNRINSVQVIIDVDLFESTYAYILSLTVETVLLSDKTAVEQAIASYDELQEASQTELLLDYNLLLNLLVEINNQIPTATQVQEYRDNHMTALSLTTMTIEISDRTIVEAALLSYALLSEAAKNELLSEKALLDSLLVRLDELAAAFVDALISALPQLGDIVLSDQLQIDDARDAYNTLNSEQKAFVVNENMLASAETVWNNLNLATQAVIFAEGTNLQADVDSAHSLINTLPDGAAKIDLQNRLNAVQDIIDVYEAQAMILNYFVSNPVVVQRFNNDSIKQTAFLSKANEIVGGLGVTITVTNSTYVDRYNTIYTILVSKNAATISFDVSVDFTR